VNAILDIPLAIRLAALFVLGAAAGGLVNLGVYCLAFRPRAISPWSRPAPSAPPRLWSDRVPILGWLGLRREVALHGRGFWIRPMLVELSCGLGFAALYWWENVRFGLLPPGPLILPRAEMITLHWVFLGHLVIISLMIVASLIDMDEKIIPDAVTVPGTLVGLLLAAVFTGPLLLVLNPVPGGPLGVQGDVMFIWVTAPNARAPALGGFPNAISLLIGLGSYWLWCAALLPRTWYSRHGWRRAMQLCCARVRRESATRWILVMGSIGSLAISGTWFWGGLHWCGLISSLIGMAGAGGLVWTIRILGAAVLKREAMGFGDVTLLAMIGAFLGWQAGLIVFFLAPLAGLVIGLVQLIVSRDNEIPYGPFLCLAATVVIVYWGAIWDWASGIFELMHYFALYMPLVALCCLAIMGALLMLFRGLRGLFEGRG
jgi:leader peptidase (prepilin peptidase) / N-methyltransferase